MEDAFVAGYLCYRDWFTDAGISDNVLARNNVRWTPQ